MKFLPKARKEQENLSRARWNPGDLLSGDRLPLAGLGPRATGLPRAGCHAHAGRPGVPPVGQLNIVKIAAIFF
jgi:hypothetical protein